MNYTKGDWRVEIKDRYPYIFATDDTGQFPYFATIATVNDWHEPECLANARLIAGAPAMYEALKEISEGKGRYSLDPLTHASNTIDDMKEVAIKALIKAEESK